MKKILFVLILMVCLSSCGPSDAQIEAAIEQTRVARPTNTTVPIPTNTPTIEPTPTPDIEFLMDLSYDDVYENFLDAGVLCNDREIAEDGSYTQECNWVIDDGMVQGKIIGQSEDTVASFFVMFVQFVDKDITDEMETAFLDFVNFGDSSQEMQSWILNNLPNILESKEEKEYSEIISGVFLMLTGMDEVVMLLLMPGQ